MKNCFGYVRVSTVKQGEGVSLEAQREAIQEYAHKNEIKISKWYEEKETAAKKGRPVFNGMIGDIKRGHADGLVIHKIDRSARNFSDWAKIHELADAGYAIEFASESLDFQSRGGRLTADIQAVIAADYIRNLREECIKGIYGRLKQGLYPFRAPLGYVDNGGGKVKTIDPIKGPMVRSMFELYASGNHSMRSLAVAMEKRGLTSWRRKRVGKSSIELMLQNTFYTGVISIRATGKVFSGIHEPLISVTLFERANDVRLNRTRKKVTRHNHTFRGMFKCGLCASAMTAEKQREHIYYRCHNNSCPIKTTRQEIIDDGIVKFLTRCNLSDHAISGMRLAFQTWFKETDSDPTPNKAPMELAKLDERLNNLTDKLIDEVIDNDTFRCKKQEILLQQQHWQSVKRQVSNLGARLQKLDKFLEHVKSLYSNYFLATSAQKREILKLVSSNNFIYGTNVDIEPRNWLTSLENTLLVFNGGPRRPTLRTDELDLLLTGMLEVIDQMDFEWVSRGCL